MLRVIKNGPIQRYVLLRVTLNMRDGEARTLALAAMSKLRHRFINDLYGYFGTLPASEKSVNIKSIKRRMLRTGNAVLGADTFQGILILGVLSGRRKPQTSRECSTLRSFSILNF